MLAAARDVAQAVVVMERHEERRSAGALWTGIRATALETLSVLRAWFQEAR